MISAVGVPVVVRVPTSAAASLFSFIEKAASAIVSGAIGSTVIVISAVSA